LITSEFGAENYPREVSGALFRIELGLREIHLWLEKEPVPKVVKVSEIQEVISLGDGSTKIRVQFHKDVIVPTTAGESERVIRALNALLGERYAVEERDAKANVDLERKGTTFRRNPED